MNGVKPTNFQHTMDFYLIAIQPTKAVRKWRSNFCPSFRVTLDQILDAIFLWFWIDQQNSVRNILNNLSLATNMTISVLIFGFSVKKSFRKSVKQPFSSSNVDNEPFCVCICLSTFNDILGCLSKICVHLYYSYLWNFCARYCLVVSIWAGGQLVSLFTHMFLHCDQNSLSHSLHHTIVE